jgi:glycine cleavage system H protein
MSNVPENLKYTKTHEWVRTEGNVAFVGITDYAQHQLTDVVYVDFPKKGETKKKGGVLLTIESVKSAEDVYSPVDGEVIEINQDLTAKPELINQDPYKYWLVKLSLKPGTKVEGLSPADYKKHIGE